MEPIVIEDVPSSMNEARMNQQFENSVSTIVPIIEDAETPTETHAETRIETPSLQLTREPPYNEHLNL